MGNIDIPPLCAKLGQTGLDLVKKKEWKAGIINLSEALREYKDPDWLLARAQAYQHIGKLHKSLADAELAYVIASKRTHPSDETRRQLAQAQYRRSVALCHMGRYADADACALWSIQLSESKNFDGEKDTVSQNVDEDGDYEATVEEVMAMKMPEQFGWSPQRVWPRRQWTLACCWRSQCLVQMQKLPKNSHGRRITVLRVPNEPLENDDSELEEEEKARKARMTPPPVEQVERKIWTQPDLRIDFYQSIESVTLVIYAKNANVERLFHKFTENMVVIGETTDEGGPIGLVVLELAAPIKPQLGGIKVTPYKIEVTMEKKDIGVKWHTWGKQRTAYADDPEMASVLADVQKRASPSMELPVHSKAKAGAPHEDSKIVESDAKKQNETKAAASAAATSEATSGASPAYPTSSKHGPKDWEKVVVNEDEDDYTDVNQFFRQLYTKSTPEQQRAMMKSFIESNGTALSTDWDDVGSRTVETQPPAGVEPKKW